MTEHTPGRLLWDQGDIGAETPHPYCDIYTDDETIIAQVNDCIGKALGAANARRLCAAWNATLTLRVEALESGVVEEMVGALEKIVGGWTGHQGHQEIARAILAKVRP